MHTTSIISSKVKQVIHICITWIAGDKIVTNGYNSLNVFNIINQFYIEEKNLHIERLKT